MKHYAEHLPRYIAGQLSAAQSAEVENHLRACLDCQDELKFWQSLAEEIQASSAAVQAPTGVVESALDRIRAAERIPAQPWYSKVQNAFHHAISLLRAQAYLVRREMWPTSAAVMALGVIAALLSNHAEVVSFIAPMLAAASLAMLYGPEHDPAFELTLASGVSMWKILLARLSVVSAYNLLISALASLAMLFIVPPHLLGMITLGWLAPMAFLSALALLLSVWLGTSNAIALCYGLWVLQFLQISQIFESWGLAIGWDAFLKTYQSFWQSPGLLLALSLVLLGAALFSTRYPASSLSQTTV